MTEGARLKEYFKGRGNGFQGTETVGRVTRQSWCVRGTLRREIYLYGHRVV